MRSGHPWIRGIALMLGSDLAFAVMAAATKSTGRSLPAPEIVFVRSVVSMAVLWALLRARNIPLVGNEPKLLIGRGVIGYIALQCYFWALPQIPLGTAVMLNYLAPVVAVALSYLWLKERPGRLVKVCLSVCLAGVWLLTAPHATQRFWPVTAALASGILAGSVHVLIRQSNRSDAPLLIVFYFTAVCTAGSGLLMLKTGVATPDAAGWSGLGIITLSSFIGQLCLTYSLQKAPVWVVSPFGYLTPVLASLIGLLLWKEVPGLSSLAGSCLIIGCGTAMMFSLKTRQAKA